MTEDAKAVIAEAKAWGVTEMPQGPGWLRLPDGLAVEVIQAGEGAVAQALKINPRV
jgi:hypothetical protein